MLVNYSILSEEIMRRGVRWLAVAAVGLAAALSACGGGEISGDAARGEEVFNTGGASQVPCATCHSLDGTDLVGPSLQSISERAGERIDGVSAEDYIRQSIVSPSAYLTDGFSDVMPKNYGAALSAEDIDALVAFLMQQ